MVASLLLWKFVKSQQQWTLIRLTSSLLSRSWQFFNQVASIIFQEFAGVFVTCLDGAIVCYTCTPSGPSAPSWGWWPVLLNDSPDLINYVCAVLFIMILFAWCVYPTKTVGLSGARVYTLSALLLVVSIKLFVIHPYSWRNDLAGHRVNICWPLVIRIVSMWISGGNDVSKDQFRQRKTRENGGSQIVESFLRLDDQTRDSASFEPTKTRDQHCLLW